MALLKYLPLLCMLNATITFGQDATVVKDSVVVKDSSVTVKDGIAVNDTAAAAPKPAPPPPKTTPTKYVNEMTPYLPPAVSAIQLAPFYDYAEAQVVAKYLKKPLILYFTDVTNNNSRTMEKRIWSVPAVAKMLKEDFVIVFLYCDEREYELPLRQQYYSKYIHKQVIHLAEKNQDLQASRYGTNGQPMLYFVNDDLSKILIEPYIFNPNKPDVQFFIDYLKKAKEVYANTH